jgi:hypothetical protein
MGPAGTLHGYTPEAKDATARSTGIADHGDLVEAALFAQAPQIFGGTDQIQHTITAERGLGLPKDPRPPG